MSREDTIYLLSYDLVWLVNASDYALLNEIKKELGL